MIWYPPRSGAEAAETVSWSFIQAYGYPPDGVWAAPGRVNLIGEHVDYNAGLCLPLALPHRTHAAMSARTDDRVRLQTSQMRGMEGTWEGSLDDVVPAHQVMEDDENRSPTWTAYVTGVAWALRQSGFPIKGFDVVLDSAVPLGAGLSSSAALECCVAAGLDDLYALGLGSSEIGRKQLAAACVQAENEIAGAPTGGMDQAASMLASAGHGLLLDCQDFATEDIALDLTGASLALLVIDTRAHHSLVDGQYGSRRRLCEQAAQALSVSSLREIADRCAEPADQAEILAQLPADDHGEAMRRALRHVITEIGRVREVAAHLRIGRLAEIGSALDASHASLRDDYAVSCAELDLAVEAARDAGALGARMTGGGFGGSAIALAHMSAVDQMAVHISKAYAKAGFREPAFLVAVPSGPARRIA